MSEDEKRERFGRYLILDHLVDGGMAKICRARFLGEQADKVVAIKMVQPQFSKDESFKTMFMDEIKVTFGLLHPNIVQTYDYGIHNEQLYVAMEYCDGRNLKEYLDKLKQKKFVFPVEISVYIVTQMCQGLHYAHTLTDKLTGKEANIIHRDISPHNVMLTYDGAIKVIDFGIAKAESNSESTQAGTIKGKLSYLAPEYLDGLELDANYDQFAVGITLWEMLCSRKLFKAANDLAVLKKIQECKVPAPSSINPNVSKELDEIVMRSLHKDRNKRYENMDQLNRALIKFLYANYPDFNSSDLSYFAKELFKDEIKKDREKLFEFGKIDIKPYLADWKQESESGGGSDASGGSAASSDGTGTERRIENVLDFGFEEEEDKTKPSMRIKRDKTKSKVDIKTGKEKKDEGMDLSVAKVRPKKSKVSSGGGDRTRKIKASADKSGTRKVKGKKGTGTTSIKRGAAKSEAIKKFAAVAIVFGAIWTFRTEIPYVNEFFKEAAVITNVKKPVVRTPASICEDKGGFYEDGVCVEKVKGIEKGSVKITLESFQKHSQKIYVNSVRVKPDFLSQIELSTGEEYVIRVEQLGRAHFIKKYMFTEGGVSETLKIPGMPLVSYAKVMTSRVCTIGEISFNLYGEERTEEVPIKHRYGIPVPLMGDGRQPANDDGSYSFSFTYKKKGQDIERKHTVKLEREDQKIDLCEIL